MDGRGKTKIWRGGLAELLESANAVQPPDQSKGAAGTAAGAKGDVPRAAHALPSANAPANAKTAVPNAWSSATRIGFASPLAADQPRTTSWHAVTRAVPIERVFPKTAAAAAKPGVAAPPAVAQAGTVLGPASAPPAPPSRAASGPRVMAPLEPDDALDDLCPPLTPFGRLRAGVARALRRKRAVAPPAEAAKTAAVSPVPLTPVLRPKRAPARAGRERLFMYGGALVLVAALITVRAVRATSKGMSARSVRATTAEVTKPGSSASTVSEAPAAIVAPAATPVSLPAGNLPRAATDALARGDYAAAQRIYAELAKSAASPSPYSEAARILAQAEAANRDSMP